VAKKPDPIKIIDPIKIANESGFPLQIAVGHQVEATSKQHGWSVLYPEHSWINRQDNKDGFIDLVLQNRRGVHLIVECKRVKPEYPWVFLPGDGNRQTRLQAKGWVDAAGRNAEWYDLLVDPPCPEATYCVVSRDDGRNPMLERICGDLISSTEAIATELVHYHGPVKQPRFYFNVVVTTAELKIAQFRPGAIPLADGRLPADTKVTDEPYVRFRKQMSLREWRFKPEQFRDGVRPDEAKENTVFVVRSTSLIEFVTKFELTKDTLARFA
jgi:hypothetical protein